MGFSPNKAAGLCGDLGSFASDLSEEEGEAAGQVNLQSRKLFVSQPWHATSLKSSIPLSTSNSYTSCCGWTKYVPEIILLRKKMGWLPWNHKYIGLRGDFLFSSQEKGQRGPGGFKEGHALFGLCLLPIAKSPKKLIKILNFHIKSKSEVFVLDWNLSGKNSGF